jgi:hypothetical protein
MCLPYQCPVLTLPHGLVTPVRVVDLVPVWTCYVSLARLALETRDERAVADVVVLQPTGRFIDGGPDDVWKKEVGLDGTETEA